MSDVAAIPHGLEERLKTVFASSKHFPPWSQYLAGRNGVKDPLGWLESVDPAAHGAAFSDLHALHKRPFIPLAQLHCQSSTVMLYLEALTGAGQNVREVLDSHLPVPLTTVGHVMVFVHSDPTIASPDCLPAHLVETIWVSVDDYLQVRDDFRERSLTLLSGVSGRTFENLIPPPPNSTLRATLDWAVRQPTIEATERNAITFLLSTPDSELKPARLPGDVVCSLKRLTGNLPIIPANALRVNPRTLEKIPNITRCGELGFLPFATNSKHVFVAVDRDSTSVYDELARHYPGLKPIIYAASSDAIRYQLNEAGRAKGGAQTSTIATEDDLKGVLWRIDPTRFSGKNPRIYGELIDDLMQFLLAEATVQRASDIHIDVFYAGTRIRYMIDGQAITIHSLPADFAPRIATKLRDSACKKTAESETPTAPQEGSFSYSFLGKRINCRIAIAFGLNDPKNPKIVLRIFDSSTGIRDLSLMGLHIDELGVLRRNLTRKQGLIIASGPTGSGKSTTLNACLGEINDPKRIVCTLEDPIEYRIPGALQLPVASKGDERLAGRVTFAEGLRLLLRMNPQIIMIGEIRDNETAAAAVNASNTGHLILTTVHANSAVDIIKRLVEMKVDRSNLGENIKLLIAQRLVRRLCSCRRQVPITAEQLDLFSAHGVKPGNWVAEPGACPKCRSTGYHGRFVILEQLEVGKDLADLISDGADSRVIREAAVKSKGYIPLFTAGLRRVASEQTSFAALREAIDEA